MHLSGVNEQILEGPSHQMILYLPENEFFETVLF
jgi:hypothetical protein